MAEVQKSREEPNARLDSLTHAARIVGAAE